VSQAGIVNISQEILPEDVPTDFIADIGSAVPIANTLNVVGGAGISVSGSGNTLTITSSASGFAWVEVTSVLNPITLVHATGYIAKGATPVNFVLPAAANVGDTFWIKGYGNLWTLSQNAMQKISIGFISTSIGVFGGMSATQIKDGIEFICVTANTEFEVLICIGNPTVF
jgi:hypothetical protein